MKKIIAISILIISLLFVAGCQKSARFPLSVTFYDITGAMSKDHTLKIQFSEEKEYENYYVDIMVKSDTNTNLIIYQEYDHKKQNIYLSKGTYVSLDDYNLFKLKDQASDSMVGYSNALTTTLIINSDNKATLTFIAILGEKTDNKFTHVENISNEFELMVDKNN